MEKKSTVRKLLALMLAIVMVLGVAACGSAPAASSEAAPSEAASSEEAPASSSEAAPAESAEASSEAPAEEGEAPMQIKWVLFNQPSTPFSADVESEVLSYIEEKYNVDIIPETVDIHDTDALSLYFAGGGDPDVITASYQVYAMYSKLIDEGIIRDIPDGWLEQYMPDWMNNCYAAMSPEAIMQQITYNDGKQYIVPFASVKNAYLMAVRKDWLDAVGMEVPTTLDELTEMLIKFHTDDPDGNGEADTYGTHMKYLWWSYLPIAMNTGNNFWLGDDGVYYTCATEEYKEYLKLLQHLIAEGGIDPESITDNEDIWKEKMINGKIGVFCHESDYFVESWSGSMLNMFGEANPDTELVIIPPLPDASGTPKVFGMANECILSGSLSFGENCSDEVMQKVMEIKNDLASDYEFYKRCKYGVEGVDYEVDENGTITALEVADQDPMIGSAFAHVPTPQEWGLSAASEWDRNLAQTYNDRSKMAAMRDGKDFFTWEANEAYDRHITDVDDAIGTMEANIYDPNFDFDAAWPEFQEKLNSLGLTEIISEYNKILGIG